MDFERISYGAVYVGVNIWCVGVHKIGTAGTLAVFGTCLTDGDVFWDFTKTDEEHALSIGQ